MRLGFKCTYIVSAFILLFSSSLFALVFSEQEQGQVFVQILETPKPMYANDNAYLVYEIYLTNFYPSPVQLSNLKLKDKEANVITELSKEQLSALIYLTTKIKSHGHTHPHSHTEKLMLTPGNMKILYIWIATDRDKIPTQISHHLSFTKPEDHSQFNVNTDPTIISLDSPMIIRPPLIGSNWQAANGPSNTSEHRKSHLVINGDDYFAQRYAIDFIQIDKKGNSYKGDKHKNASYYCYGKEILSVASGTVVAIKNSLPENIPNSGKPAININMDTVGGNYVLMDIGNNTYAFYAHLIPNSLTVKVGDLVEAGKILGKIGNSGNSTEPHLHFHLVDKASPLGANGIPYVYTEFWVQPTETVVINSKPELRLLNEETKKVTNQMILQDTIVTFK